MFSTYIFKIERGENMDKYDKIYIWHEITKAKLKLRVRELKKMKEARRWI